MKRLLIIGTVLFSMAACNNPNPGESGAVNDGIKAVDTNGAFEESTPSVQKNPGTDTTAGEDRVDVQPRLDSTGRK